jgi:hypothetical protein
VNQRIELHLVQGSLRHGIGLHTLQPLIADERGFSASALA